MNESELNQWTKHIIGKPCPYHPNRVVKDGKWGIWCGGKDELGRWCSPDPTREFLELIRKEKV